MAQDVGARIHTGAQDLLLDLSLGLLSVKRPVGVCLPKGGIEGTPSPFAIVPWYCSLGFVCSVFLLACKQWTAGHACMSQPAVPAVSAMEELWENSDAR